MVSFWVCLKSQCSNRCSQCAYCRAVRRFVLRPVLPFVISAEPVAPFVISSESVPFLVISTERSEWRNLVGGVIALSEDFSISLAYVRFARNGNGRVAR